jgi:hypothetical protein
VSHVNPTVETQLVSGFGFQASNLYDSNPFFSVQDTSGNDQIMLQYNADGSISALRGGTLIARSAANLLTPTIWAHIEIKAKIHSSAGYVYVRFNGNPTPIISFTGNTQASGTAGWQRCGPSRFGGTLLFDDWFIISGNGGEADFHGDARIRAILPASDGSVSQWTPNTAGAHASKVNEAVQDGDTSYLYDSTPGNRELFNYADVGSFTGSIRSVMMRSFMRKDDAGTRQVRTVCKSGAAVSVGSTFTLSTSLDGYNEIIDNDPATGQPWTEAGLNAAEFGIETVA